MATTSTGPRAPVAATDWVTDPEVLGAHRSLEPVGVFPHLATRLDARSEPNDHEISVDVELLNIDATSYRSLRERGEGDPERIAALISEIVAERGKLQNPWTGSGGVLVGRASSVGARAAAGGLEPGRRIVPLASLIAIPLLLDSVGPVDPRSPQVPASGRAIVTGAMPWAAVPPDLPLDVALTAFDVYPVASHVRSRARAGQHVLVLGGGHAGLLAAVAAQEAVGESGTVTVVDATAAALERVASVAPRAVRILADATDALAAARALQRAGLDRADLSLICTSVPGCEGTALLATATAGTVLFFSTATSFPAAALGADIVSSVAELVIPNGCTEDRGSYTVELLRRVPALRGCFESVSGTTTATGR